MTGKQYTYTSLEKALKESIRFEDTIKPWADKRGKEYFSEIRLGIADVIVLTIQVR